MDVERKPCLAQEKQLVFRDHKLCIVPGYEMHPVGRVLLGRREIMVAVFHPEDIDALLTMPECPVQLAVMVGSTLYVEGVKRLRERFGDRVL